MRIQRGQFAGTQTRTEHGDNKTVALAIRSTLDWCRAIDHKAATSEAP